MLVLVQSYKTARSTNINRNNKVKIYKVLIENKEKINRKRNYLKTNETKALFTRQDNESYLFYNSILGPLGKLLSDLSMTSRVKPGDVFVVKTVQQTMSHISFDESSQTEENVNKELLQAVQGVYSPVLKTMKLFGAYFGDTTFNRLVHVQAPGSCNKQSYISRFYCGIIVSGLWFNFALPLVSIFFGGPIYLLLFFDMWCLLVALNGTVCLIVLPLTDTRKSRFEKFLSKVMFIYTGNITLENVKSKMKRYLKLFIFFVLVSIGGAVLLEVAAGMGLGVFEPWTSWFGFRIMSDVLLAIGCGFWLLPMIFFCITCLFLESLFDDLYKRMSSMDLSALITEHNKLCEIVELADNVLSPLLLMVVGLCIPFICFALYHMANLPEQGTSFLTVSLLWFFATSAVLAVVLVFGSRVNEKVGKGTLCKLCNN